MNQEVGNRRASLRIVLVDDDRELSFALSSILQSRGHVPRCFQRAEDALESLRTHHADLVLLDLNLPGMTGWELRIAQKLDPLLSAIPVIVMSGDPSPQAAATDAVDFLRKPISRDALLSAVDRASDRIAHTRELLRAREYERMLSLGALLGGIAHEINNPLTFVFGGLDLLHRQLASVAMGADGELDVPAALRAVHRIREGAERVTSVVGAASLLAFADVETMEPLDVHQVIESCLQVASNEIRHTAELIREYEDVPRVYGNQAQLAQIVLNLLLNALHAMREREGRAHVLRIGTAQAGDMVLVSVSDSASVVSTEPHEARNASALAAVTGQRFGLTVSIETAARMGGLIEVIPAKDLGATFRVCLPAHGHPSQPPPGGPFRVTPSARRVLVVDDEPLVSEIFAVMLSEEYAVTTLSSPRAALSALMEQDYDVVLCDVMMPEMSGAELFEKVVAIKPALRERFAFVTGGVFSDRLRSQLKRTRRPVLRKPCSQDDLLALVGRVLVERNA